MLLLLNKKRFKKNKIGLMMIDNFFNNLIWLYMIIYDYYNIFGIKYYIEFKIYLISMVC